ncbi:unnamed protein product, partial [Iphiclides podalirius]
MSYATALLVRLFRDLWCPTPNMATLAVSERPFVSALLQDRYFTEKGKHETDTNTHLAGGDEQPKPGNFFDAVPPLITPLKLNTSSHGTDSGKLDHSHHTMADPSATFEADVAAYVEEQAKAVESAVESNQEFLHEEIHDEAPEETFAHDYDDE